MVVCYQKGKEKGLWFEKKCMQDILNSPTASPQDKKIAKGFLRNCKNLSEKDYGAISVGVGH